MSALPAEREAESSAAAERTDVDVRLEGLRKHYGDVAAVDGVDLDVGRGEFFTMLGPSGSGKTTTLRLIAGFERPDAGAVLLRGRDVTDDPPYARNVNTVFQDYALFPHMSVEENVAYGLKIKRVPAAERRARVEEALATVQLSGFGGRRPGQLSGGQRQRVALARALVNRPQVLLLDEPLGALDLKLRQEMQIELKRIQREVGITFVYVTHDQDEALTMSDRLAVFNRGRIEQVGPPAEVYEHPRTEFVAGFVGVSNLLERDGHDAQRSTGEDPPPRRRRGRAARRARRERDDPRGGLRRDGHALHRGAGARRRADRRRAEPGDDVGAGARGTRAEQYGWPGDLSTP